MIELACKTFMPIQTLDLHRVSNMAAFFFCFCTTFFVIIKIFAIENAIVLFYLSYGVIIASLENVLNAL